MWEYNKVGSPLVSDLYCLNTMMKLFELRNNFHKMSLPDFKNELAKQKSLDELDYKHFLISAFKEKRSARLLISGVAPSLKELKRRIRDPLPL